MEIRNVAIIAHVDHGKTTLVDGLLKQSNVFRDPNTAGELILDRNELEREKGITILSKVCAVTFRGVKLNIIDTPGHADFGGEVERVIGMADGCLLLVDAGEGPLPQTRFVLKTALAAGLRPILVVNKVDRSDADPAATLGAAQDLFLDLATDADQLDFPVLYTVGREGRAGLAPDRLASDLRPLFETIVRHVPPPAGEPDGPFLLQVAALDYDDYRGRFAIGRIRRGRVRPGDALLRLGPGDLEVRSRAIDVFVHEGLGRVAVAEAVAGDIVAIIGIEDVGIGDTLADPAEPIRLPRIPVGEPTVKMSLGVNTSPFSGRDGRFLTSRQLWARLRREVETNVALRVRQTDSPDTFEVAGRGELHLAIVAETIRREGYEFELGRPEVILQRDADGRLVEPVERVVIDSTERHIGVIAELLGPRLARLVNMQPDGKGNLRLEYEVPTRGLIGLRSAFLSAARGEGTLWSIFLGYEPWAGPLTRTRNGALVAHETGWAVTYGLLNAEGRGMLFIGPGVEVYEGMIVGLNSREEDIVVNVCKQKKMTNVRSETKEIDVRLSPPLDLTLEQALDLIQDDELVEVTPHAMRLRKRHLRAGDRARSRRVVSEV
ncbi:MAG: translational GTPase TypA [Chloroflexi bacterium]|nr:translational GTPase TypA [Chloroflexota bacterium]